MIGSFVSVSLYATLGMTEDTGVLVLILGLILVLAISMFASGALNVMIERVAYRPLRNAPKLAPLITAIGMSFILQNVGLLWRPSPDSPPDLIRSQQEVLDIGGVNLVRSDIFAWLVTIPLLITLLYFVGQTKYGKAMRATAQDPDAARLMGINVDRTIGLTFLLGGLLAGAAGLIYALYNGTVQFNQGFTAGLIAFTAAVMGGIGNLKGAVVGGLIIGIIQQTVESRLDNGSAWAPAVVFAILVLVMVFRPAGSLRRGDARRMSTTTETKPGAARHRGRMAPVTDGFNKLAGLLPNWAWAIFWLVRRVPLRALRRSVRRRALRVDHHDAGLRDDGPRAQHRCRLRGPARPRLRRVLRDRRVRRRLVHVRPLRRLQRPHPRRRSDQDPAGHPHQLLLRGLHRGGVHGAVGGDPGCTDAASARRLPRDRDARVRRDRAARVRALDERPARPRQPRHLQRPPGHHAGGQALVPDPGPGQHHPHRHHAVLLHRAGDAARGAVHQHPPARLAPRAGRGSRSARTRSRPPPWASTSCG